MGGGGVCGWEGAAGTRRGGRGFVWGADDVRVSHRAGPGQGGPGGLQRLRGGGVEFSSALLNAGLLLEDVVLRFSGEGPLRPIQLLLLLRAPCDGRDGLLNYGWNPRLCRAFTLSAWLSK